MDNPLAMSDDDFSKLSSPPVADGVSTPATEVVEETTTEQTEPEAKTEEVPASGSKESTVADDKSGTDGNQEDETSQTKTDEAGPTAETALEKGEQTHASKPKTEPVGTGKVDDKGVQVTDPKVSVPGSNAAEAASPPDYEALYKSFMAPFKANGKTIEPKSPEEVLQLMRMGANYTRKMQDIAPHRKILLMLQNNGLLDEGQLSHLIDVKKKDPEAIKKLLKDAGVDPLSIDTSVEPTYREGNHRVSDEEANFMSVVEDLGSTPSGKEMLKVIDAHWDQASKEALWKSPELMTVMEQQRADGFYQRITETIEHDMTVGNIPKGMPFLAAYKQVGDRLAAADGFADLIEKSKTAVVPVVKKAAPVAVRAATVKPAVANSAQANAASAPRSAPRKAGVLVNPLSMSDDEFMKLPNVRV